MYKVGSRFIEKCSAFNLTEYLRASSPHRSANLPLRKCLAQALLGRLDTLASSLRQDMDLQCSLEIEQMSWVKQPLILAIDDDEDNLLLITQILSLSNYSFITATNGWMALSMAEERLPDLILLDVMLPDLDGAELVQRLRQNPQTVEIPVIAVTAMARKEDRDRLLEAGCNDYISKPYMVDDLEELIRHYLFSHLPPAV